jgi:hypothetical protein
MILKLGIYIHPADDHEKVKVRQVITINTDDIKGSDIFNNNKHLKSVVVDEFLKFVNFEVMRVANKEKN